MGIAQDTFQQYRDNAYEGQVSSLESAKIVSRRVETAALAFGKPVISGSGARSCTGVTGATVAADIEGFTVRSLAVENDSNGNAVYAVGVLASIIREGKIYAKCVDGATAKDHVFIVVNVAGGNALGDLRGTADGTNTIELTHVTWTDDVAAGAIGEIDLGIILA